MNTAIRSQLYTSRMDHTDDLMIVDEYDDGTYRLYLGGHYSHEVDGLEESLDEVDQDFATVEAIRSFMGLVDDDKLIDLHQVKTNLLKEIRAKKEALEKLNQEIENLQRGSERLIPFSESAKRKAAGLLEMIEGNKTVYHKVWGDVRTVSVDQDGRSGIGPKPMLPPREEDEGEENAES